jgi:hypothetical protein
MNPYIYFPHVGSQPGLSTSWIMDSFYQYTVSYKFHLQASLTYITFLIQAQQQQIYPIIFKLLTRTALYRPLILNGW